MGIWKSISGWGTSKCKGPEVVGARSVWETARRPVGWRRRGEKWETGSGIRKGHCKDLGINSVAGLVWGRKVTRSELCFIRIIPAALRIDVDGTRVKSGSPTAKSREKQLGIPSGHFLPYHGGSCDFSLCRKEANPPVSQETTSLLSSASHWLQELQQPCATEKMGAGRAEKDTFSGRKMACNPWPFLPFLTETQTDDRWMDCEGTSIHPSAGVHLSAICSIKWSKSSCGQVVFQFECETALSILWLSPKLLWYINFCFSYGWL